MTVAAAAPGAVTGPFREDEILDSITIRGDPEAVTALERTISDADGLLLVTPEVLVARAREKFDEDGKLTDERTREFLTRYLTTLGEWIRTFA